mmetsp:Transcript_16143/g.19420  ORF Transcript_16143/g.19420 Transcript_16143/m.19420 type:complete len:87 (+) Transcript_16143:327-587(+)
MLIPHHVPYLAGGMFQTQMPLTQQASTELLTQVFSDITSPRLGPQALQEGLGVRGLQGLGEASTDVAQAEGLRGCEVLQHQLETLR